VAAVLQKIDESDNHLLLSQFDHEIRPLGLKDDVPTEDPTTMTEDDPVVTISEDTEDAIVGTSAENT